MQVRFLTEKKFMKIFGALTAMETALLSKSIYEKYVWNLMSLRIKVILLQFGESDINGKNKRSISKDVAKTIISIAGGILS